MRIGLTVVALLVLTRISSSIAMEYPCPSDPGFCYLDVGTDGCWDSDVDSGPINALLEAGDFPVPMPPGPLELPTAPGSIVCPPSVKKLTMAANLRWRTALGSDILLHGTKIETSHDAIEIVSGRDAAFGDLKARDPVFDDTDGFLIQADRDVYLGGRILDISPKKGKALNVIATTGRISGVAKASIVSVGDVTGLDTRLEAGEDIALSGFRFVGKRAILRAGADVLLEKPKFKSLWAVGLEGVNVISTGRTTVKSPTNPFAVRATGDAVIEQAAFSVRGLTIETGSFTMGVPKNGKVRRSRVVLKRKSYQGVTINVQSTGPIRLEGVLIKGLYSDSSLVPSRIQTSGASIELLDSEFRGDTDLDIHALGAGSVCDRTGTTFEQFVFVDWSCDTLVGP